MSSIQWTALLALVLSSFAFAEPSPASSVVVHSSQDLHPVFPAGSTSRDESVSVKFVLDGTKLRAHFEVRSDSINAKQQLGATEHPYQWDVVELFVSVSSANGEHQPYYEFEVSPFNQSYQVEIKGLREPFREGVDLGLEHAAQRTAQGWSADLAIPLEVLGWDGDESKIFGNAYAILGKRQKKKYWSLFLPVQKKPNFHLPQHFRPLLKTPNTESL